MKKFLFACVLMFAAIITACGKHEDTLPLEESTKDTIETIEPAKTYVKIEIKDDNENVLITTEDIKFASSGIINYSNDSNEYVVSVTFTDEATQSFKEATSELIGSSIKIYVDNKLISNPQIKETISSREIQLATFDSPKEATDLVNKINGIYYETTSENETSTKTPLYNIEMKDADGNVRITGDDIRSVSDGQIIDVNGTSTYVVNISFTDTGTQKFTEVTSELVGSNLEIYVDNKLINNAKITEPITGGSAQIACFNTHEEADELIARIQQKESQ